jgi:hypothetical protein
MAVGCRFRIPRLLFLAGSAPEVAVFTTVHSPCARRALRPEVAMPRQIPVHIITAPPIRLETIVPTLYDPEEFAALYHADKDRAIALVAAMTEPQRVRQALAYCAWLGYHGLEIDLATVLAAWEGS